MMGRGWDYGSGAMGAGGWFAMLLTAFFLALIVAGVIVLVIWAIRAASGHGGQHRQGMHGGPGGYRQEGRTDDSGYEFLGPRSGRSDDAVEIARRRFASGEITREQYDELLNALNR